MTPQEKSKELLIKVKDSLTEKANKDDMLWEMTVHYQTIDIVLLMIDEILENTMLYQEYFDAGKPEHHKEFWQQVKQEVTSPVSMS